MAAGFGNFEDTWLRIIQIHPAMNIYLSLTERLKTQNQAIENIVSTINTNRRLLT